MVTTINNISVRFWWLLTTQEINKDVSNTLYALSYFQKYYSFKAVIFSKSRVVDEFCKHYGLTVITEFSYFHYCHHSVLTLSTNPYSLPYFNFMLNQARFLFSSAHYGYLNSDILVSTELFRTLHECQHLVSQGVVKPNVFPFLPFSLLVSTSRPCSRNRHFSNPIDPHILRALRLDRFSSCELFACRVATYPQRGWDCFAVMIVGLLRVLERDGPVETAQRGGGAKPDWQLFDGCAAKTRRVVDWCDIAEWGRSAGLSIVPAVHQGLCGFMCRAKPMRLSFMNHNWNRFYLLSPWVGFGSLNRADYTFRSLEGDSWLIDEELRKKYKGLVIHLW